MKPPEDQKPALTRSDVETLLEIGQRRAALLYRLKQAILAGDEALERQLAREVVGLPKEIAQ